jgi:UDP-glucose 4-epimerase
MNVLVTGGSGFLGSHLVDALTAAGHHVTAPGSRECDLLDLDAVRDAVARIRPDSVFHLAAVVNLERSLEMADACMRLNVIGTLNLLRALESTALDAFVFASTTEVYGDGPVPFREEQPANPPSPYAVSKLAAEQLVLSLYRTRGFPAVVTRLTTTYGPRQPRHRLIPSLIEAYARGEAPALSTPSLSRDLLYVDDAVKGLVKAAENPGARGAIVNLGNETTHTIAQVAESVRALMGAALAPRYGAQAARADEAPVWASNVDKARQLLGWVPETPLVEGLERTIEWFRAQTADIPNYQRPRVSR